MDDENTDEEIIQPMAIEIDTKTVSAENENRKKDQTANKHNETVQIVDNIPSDPKPRPLAQPLSDLIVVDSAPHPTGAGPQINNKPTNTVAKSEKKKVAPNSTSSPKFFASIRQPVPPQPLSQESLMGEIKFLDGEADRLRREAGLLRPEIRKLSTKENRTQKEEERLEKLTAKKNDLLAQAQPFSKKAAQYRRLRAQTTNHNSPSANSATPINVDTITTPLPLFFTLPQATQQENGSPFLIPNINDLKKEDSFYLSKSSKKQTPDFATFQPAQLKPTGTDPDQESDDELTSGSSMSISRHGNQ